MLSGMMGLKKKTTKGSKRENVGRMILKKIKYRKRKDAGTIPPKEVTLLMITLHAKNRRESTPRVYMNPILAWSRSRLRKRRNKRRKTPIPKARSVTKAGKVRRRKRKKVIFHRTLTLTPTRKLIIGRTASPSLRNTRGWKLSNLMT